MNFIDRTILSVMLCSILYAIEKCSYHEFAISTIIITAAWVIFGKFEDYQCQ